MEYIGIEFGVRQGPVLSPILFALYIDDICDCNQLAPGCSIVLYADDVLLIAPSVVENLDMVINTKQERPAVTDKPARCLRNVCTVYVRAVGL